MQANGYARLLQQIRRVEKTRNVDKTDEAMTVFNLRSQSIVAGPGTDEQKDALTAKAATQWTTFMQRDMPTAG